MLKPIFGRRNGATWGIEHLVVVPLQARDAGSAEFYPVQDDVVLAQPNYLSTVLAVLGETIVPVVAIDPNEDVIRCLGTGFFISCSGFLITAGHVITDPIERRYGGVRETERGNWLMDELKIGVMISMHPFFQGRGYLFRPIEWAGFLGARVAHPLPGREPDLKLTSDLALCKVAANNDDMPYQPLSIVQPGLRGIGLMPGKSATAVGYAGMQDVPVDSESGKLLTDFRFNLHVSSGQILERFPNNAATREVPTPGACFSASLKLPPGMSGSPIFDDERIYVHGVVSRGLEGEHGPEDFGYGSMLGGALAMPIKPLGGGTLLDLMKSGKEGIPRLSVAGA